MAKNTLTAVASNSDYSILVVSATFCILFYLYHVMVK